VFTGARKRSASNGNRRTECKTLNGIRQKKEKPVLGKTGTRTLGEVVERAGTLVGWAKAAWRAGGKEGEIRTKERILSRNRRNE